MVRSEPEYDERQRQIEAGRQMARNEGEDVFLDTRETLDDVSVLAARGLKSIIESSDADDKVRVLACNSVLDRTGHPPERKVRVTDANPQQSELRSVLAELIGVIRTLPPEHVQALRAALADPNIIEAEVLEPVHA